MFILRETGNRASEAYTLTNLGALAKAMGRPDETARYCEQALVIFEAIGNAPMAGVMRGNLRGNLRPDASPKPRRGWRWLRWFPWFR